MKKFNLIMLLALSLSFITIISCTDEEDNSQKREIDSRVVGIWQTWTTDLNTNTNYYNPEKNSEVEFNKNGKFRITYPNKIDKMVTLTGEYRTHIPDDNWGIIIEAFPKEEDSPYKSIEFLIYNDNIDEMQCPTILYNEKYHRVK